MILGAIMTHKKPSKAKVIRDVGKTSIHFKVDDEVFTKLNNILGGRSKQDFFESVVHKLIEQGQPNTQNILEMSR